MTFPAGGGVLGRFEAEDFLASHSADEALLGVPFRLAGDVRLDQQYRPDRDGWEMEATRIRRTEGLHWSGNVDVDGIALLARCDSARPVADLLADLAWSLAPGTDDTAASWLATVRRLVECGFLVPA